MNVSNAQLRAHERSNDAPPFDYAEEEKQAWIELKMAELMGDKELASEALSEALIYWPGQRSGRADLRGDEALSAFLSRDYLLFGELMRKAQVAYCSDEAERLWRKHDKERSEP